MVETTRINCPVLLSTSFPRSTIREGYPGLPLILSVPRHSLGPRSVPIRVITLSGGQAVQRGSGNAACYPFVPEWNLSSCQQIPGRAGAAHVWPAVWAKAQSSAGAEWASAETTSWTAGAS